MYFLQHSRIWLLRNTIHTNQKAVGEIGKGLDKHICSWEHRKSMTIWEIFEANQVPIESRLNPHFVKLVQDNKEYFIVIKNIFVILACRNWHIAKKMRMTVSLRKDKSLWS